METVSLVFTLVTTAVLGSLIALVGPVLKGFEERQFLNRMRVQRRVIDIQRREQQLSKLQRRRVYRQQYKSSAIGYKGKAHDHQSFKVKITYETGSSRKTVEANSFNEAKEILEVLSAKSDKDIQKE